MKSCWFRYTLMISIWHARHPQFQFKPIGFASRVQGEIPVRGRGAIRKQTTHMATIRLAFCLGGLIMNHRSNAFNVIVVSHTRRVALVLWSSKRFLTSFVSFALQNSNILITFYLCTIIIFCNEVSSKPVQQNDNITRVKVSSNEPQTLPVKPPVITAQTQNTKFRSVAASTNGAFGSVNMINHHALNHKINKDMELKKKGERRRIRVPKPTVAPKDLPCIFASPEANKDTPVVGSNTLFMSRNWGNQ